MCKVNRFFFFLFLGLICIGHLPSSLTAMEQEKPGDIKDHKTPSVRKSDTTVSATAAPKPVAPVTTAAAMDATAAPAPALSATPTGGAAEAPFSSIFKYQGGVLHVNLKGKTDTWYAKNIMQEDSGFYEKDIFGKLEVMKQFGDGQVRPADKTKANVGRWVERFAKSQPHGALTIFDSKTQRKIGYVVAGAGDDPGASEIAGAGLVDYWGKKIGTDVMETLVTQWAPEVRRIGLGQGLDKVRFKPIIQAFQCFGGKPLERLEATASPSNPGSWHILDKFGFKAAVTRRDKSQVISLEKMVLTDEALAAHLLKLFDPVATPKPLSVGVRYKLIEPSGKERTFSRHKDYQVIKYHFEYVVPTVQK